ncbi:hypothetical protein GCM10011378_39350 [Hymenobacter glacieicola]|uniref:Uncharacterized protein n=1 Tax=Hymenobacter glacieicola TaxID=1562124 RepID=A0ABQ1X4F2_9BACT|nr:hypothetical protein GCM10011378_39350 [Hymenobacter glacieicola]
MANELPSTLRHLIPSYLEREVSRLLNSQGQFLTGRKRSSAALTALKELYSQLEDCWEQLTWSRKTPAIESMRSEARNILRNLERSDQSVIRDLEKEFERELSRSETDLQTAEQSLQMRKKNFKVALESYQQQKDDWTDRLQLENSKLPEYYRTLKDEQNDLAKQCSVDVVVLESSLQTVNALLNEFESGNIPASELSWTERRASLTKRRNDLMQRKQSLQQKRQVLEQRKQRLSETQEDVYQTSQKLSEKLSYLKAITKNCRNLKAQLVQQGKLTVNDFPDIPMPLI